MSIAVWFASLLGGKRHSDCSRNAFKRSISEELMRCERRGVDLFTIETHVTGQVGHSILRCIACELSPIDVATVDNERLHILCPGHSELATQELARRFSRLCQQQGLKANFEVVCQNRRQPAVKSAFEVQASATIGVS